MKPAVDEMFPEGAGPYVDLDETSKISLTMMTSSEVLSHCSRAQPLLQSSVVDLLRGQYQMGLKNCRTRLTKRRRMVFISYMTLLIPECDQLLSLI
ncbi:PREDICTED: myeloma-overexpressed gene 2 protein isoform X1 [Galeopterus variegatus]|uniref:COP9 signalosome complex subunit 9 n=1 Tax=Galeopterus variegatus TaxID=482537 RepID=A0ABM0RWB6_GALVR|nr:PREDICTED: myeloma-overexpressed gene 2 protein isoform X1 [Galeopterus variegatus]